MFFKFHGGFTEQEGEETKIKNMWQIRTLVLDLVCCERRRSLPGKLVGHHCRTEGRDSNAALLGQTPREDCSVLVVTLQEASWPQRARGQDRRPLESTVEGSETPGSGKRKFKYLFRLPSYI